MKSLSSTHAIVATSSGEAEYNALVRGAAEALGLKAGRCPTIDIISDLAAATSTGVEAGTGEASTHGGDDLAGCRMRFDEGGSAS